MHAPNLLNFIILCQKFPFLIQLFLEFCTSQEIWNKDHAKISSSKLTNAALESQKKYKFYTVIFDGIKSGRLKNLNKRQSWFLENLVSGSNIKKYDIIKFWQVSGRTADRDIAGLLELEQIKFVGSNRSGKYVVNF